MMQFGLKQPVYRFGLVRGVVVPPVTALMGVLLRFRVQILRQLRLSAEI